MTRVIITLDDDERDALSTLAQHERRAPRDQAALLIRQQLEVFGYLPTTQPQPATPQINTTQAAQA